MDCGSVKAMSDINYFCLAVTAEKHSGGHRLATRFLNFDRHDDDCPNRSCARANNRNVWYRRAADQAIAAIPGWAACS